MKAPATYPHNSSGAMYPFPQGRPSARCPLPGYNTDTVATAYTNWKMKFYKTGTCGGTACGWVASPENNNEVFSEGIAYGMLIGVYMNDRPMFDALWAYVQDKFDGKGLMNWHYNSSGGLIQGGAATDADQDMAWALLMAGAQWGGGTYNAAAVKLINNIMSHEVEQGSNVLKPGDNFGGSSQTNPSYFAPSYYRAFAKATGNNGWMAVLDKSYTILEAASGSNGLVPNWANAQGSGVASPGDAFGPHFGYDACRTPWRIALDYCETGEPRAKTYLDKIVAFYVSQAPVGLGTIKDGYTSAGGDPPGALGDYAAGMAFYGPAGVAAMAGGPESFRTAVMTALAGSAAGPYVTQRGIFTYFHGSWGVLSLLTLSGNFWNMLP